MPVYGVNKIIIDVVKVCKLLRREKRTAYIVLINMQITSMAIDGLPQSFIMALTKKHRALLVKLFNQNDDPTLTVIRKFWT